MLVDHDVTVADSLTISTVLLEIVCVAVTLSLIVVVSDVRIELVSVAVSVLSSVVSNVVVSIVVSVVISVPIDVVVVDVVSVID